MKKENEIISFMEDLIREIYGIDMKEPVTIDLYKSCINVHAPYITSETIHIDIKELLKQLKGVSNCTSFLRAKSKYVKAIIKNNIHACNLKTPFFQKELNYLIQNKRSIIKDITIKANQIKGIDNFISKISRIYAIDLSNLSLYCDLKQAQKAYNELKSFKIIDSAFQNGIYQDLKCKLSKGIVTFSIYGIAIYQHNLLDSSYSYILSFTDSIISKYKKMKYFFDEVIPKNISREIMQINATTRHPDWIKIRNILNLNTNMTLIPCSTNKKYSNFYIDNISIASPEIIPIYKQRDIDIEQLELETNTQAIKYIQYDANKLFYSIIHLIHVKPDQTIETYIKILTESENTDKYRYNEIQKAIDEMIDQNHIIVSSKSQLTCPSNIYSGISNTIDALNRAKKYFETNINGSEDLIKESKIYYSCSRDDSHVCSPADLTCPICNSMVTKTDLLGDIKIKDICEMNIFELYVFMKYGIFYSVPNSDKYIHSLLELVEKPKYLIPLKNEFLNTFSQYNNGKYLSLIKMKCILNGI